MKADKFLKVCRKCKAACCKIGGPNFTEKEMKKGQIIQEKIKEAKEAIFESKYLTKIKRIILFGSAVEKQLSLRSDIAVEFDEISEKEAAKFRINILGKVNDKVDIQVYNVLPAKIKKEIDEKGKILFEKSDNLDFLWARNKNIKKSTNKIMKQIDGDENEQI